VFSGRAATIHTHSWAVHTCACTVTISSVSVIAEMRQAHSLSYVTVFVLCHTLCPMSHSLSYVTLFVLSTERIDRTCGRYYQDDAKNRRKDIEGRVNKVIAADEQVILIYLCNIMRVCICMYLFIYIYIYIYIYAYIYIDSYFMQDYYTYIYIYIYTYIYIYIHKYIHAYSLRLSLLPCAGSWNIECIL
jgi:hypothetical protein